MRLALLAIIVAIIVAQFVPVTRGNPPLQADFDDNLDVKRVLKKSCYDCHSDESVWPWYSYVAPVSWLVASDVQEAREKLNFSDWGLLSPERQSNARQEIWEEIEKGEMPLKMYLLMHSDAAPTDADKALIRDWSGGSSTGRDSDDDE